MEDAANEEGEELTNNRTSKIVGIIDKVAFRPSLH